jgi:hypothetical protein
MLLADFHDAYEAALLGRLRLILPKRCHTK